MIANGTVSLDTKKRGLFERRIVILYWFLFIVGLVVIGRLIDLQIVNGKQYQAQARKQQFGTVELTAQRGTILSKNSKTNESSILATNTTLDLVYIDPKNLSSRHAEVADDLATILVTERIDGECRAGRNECPAELVDFYRPAFDPLAGLRIIEIPTASGGIIRTLTGSTHSARESIPSITEIRRQFARSIENRIKETSVTFVPLLYGADRFQVAKVEEMSLSGIFVNDEESLVYANPDLINPKSIHDISRILSSILFIDPSILRSRLERRVLRYVPIMGRLTHQQSDDIQKLKNQHAEEAKKEIVRQRREKTRNVVVEDPYRSIALIAEHWRYYPDTTIASHVIGFVNALQEPQYGIERSFDTILRGQTGNISSVKDPFGGQIISTGQEFRDPRDGADIVLTIDRHIQDNVEKLLDAMVKKVDAESGQVIVLEPETGRILAMANAPLFDSNAYASVYRKEPFAVQPDKEKTIVVEVMNPETNNRVLKAYLEDITPEGLQRLSQDTNRCGELCLSSIAKVKELQRKYKSEEIQRYYYYLGDNNRREIFPTHVKGLWLKYRNNIGVGSYVNRTIQEVYEPGSVMKPITMAVAIDQGEVNPTDVYSDTGAIKVDRFVIGNALNKFYGNVTMIDCISLSINTCMTSVSVKLGKQLFHSALEQFGFGRVSGIELDNELTGDLKVLSEWNKVLVMTTSYGQGIAVTPLQMVTAFATLANGGKLMRPTIIDEIRRSDGSIERREPIVVAQVLKPETVAIMTAMLTHSAEFGFAKAGKVKHYRIAGKTGTSQIAGPGGKYETGTGSTIASYAGYAPIDHPKFVILVKLDRPKKDDFGSKSAAPLFRDIASFLFDYYDIPPDEK